MNQAISGGCCSRTSATKYSAIAWLLIPSARAACAGSRALRSDSAAICSAAAHPSLRWCNSSRSAGATCTPRFASRPALSASEKCRSRSRSSHSSPAIRSRCSRSGGSTRLASTSWAFWAGQRSTRSVMGPDTAGAAYWKSSTMMADPGGSFAASLAIEAVTSADTVPSIASRSAASEPNARSTAWGASMNPVQKRSGLASAPSHDSQDVTPGGRVSVQLDSRTLLPAPAEPTTTVRRWPAPAVSCSCSIDRATSVAGSIAGRNLASANRRFRDATRSAAASSTTDRPPGSSLLRAISLAPARFYGQRIGQARPPKPG